MGSFPSDLTMKVNIDPTSALATAKKMDELLRQGAKGDAEAYKQAAEMGMSMAKQLINTSTRAGRQLETQLRSIEKQTQSLGKTATEMNEQQRSWMLERARGLKNQEEQEKRINAIYDQRRKYFQEEERRQQQKGPGTGALLFRGARDIFEGRMSYGMMDLGRAALGGMGGGGAAAGGAAAGAGAGGVGGVLAGISGTALAIGGVAAALVGVEVAGYAAAKAIGEFGREVHDVQIKTGMTAVEVQRLQFAAQVTGQDIGIVDRMMRGLTMAIEGTDKKAFAAAKTLQDMGVDLVALQKGGIKPLELLQQISTALEKQPNKWLQNKEAMDLFGRSGIPALPMITELNRALGESGKLHFVDQDQIDRWREGNVEIARMETELKLIKLHLEGLVAKPFIITIDVVGKLGDLLTKGMGQQEKSGQEPDIPEDLIGRFRAAMGAEKTAERAPYVAAQQYAKELQKNSLEAAEQELSAAKEVYDEDLKRAALGTVMIDQLKEHEAIYKRIRDHVEAMRKADSDRKAIAEALRRSILNAEQQRENPFALPAEAALNRDLRMHGITPADAFRFSWHAAPQILFERGQQAAKFQTEMLGVQETTQRELMRARLGGIEPVNVRELGQGGVTRADVEHDIVEQYQQRVEIAKETRTIEEDLINKRKIDAKDNVGLAQKARDLEAVAGKELVANAEATMAIKKQAHALAQRERDEERKHTETMSRIQLADQEESIKHDADLARKQAELRFKGDNPAAGIAESYRIAVEESHQLYDLEMQRIALHETGYKAEEDAAMALHKLHREDEAAREDAQLKLAQMQQQQLDALKSKIEPLYHTLFTNPRQFGTQLRQTVQEAALHPIVSGLSEMTATALHPLIYGAGGTGGIAGTLGGMFGGGRLNDVHLINGAVPVHIVGAGGGFGGGGGGFFGGGYGGGGGGGLPSFAQLANLPMTTGSYGGMDFGGMALSSALGGGVGTSLYNLPTGGSSGMNFGAMTLASALGGGGTASGGRGFNLGGLGGLARGLSGWKQMLGFGAVRGSTPGSESLARAAEGPGVSAGGAFSLRGFAGSPLARAGAMTGGMMAAQSGLLGQQRGTGLGVLEGTLGGAAIGFSLAPPGFQPLGAAIGAGVGLGIGLGEMIAGVESPRNEAKRLVRSVYHISINNTTADQIVSIANQSYSGHVSIAVRSPEVRHMLGLYAAGTGQGSIFAQSSNEPHGASLVESGGILAQQATYQYGQAFSQSSNLPIYGGTPTHVLGPPGGGMQLSLNIGGQDAARFLQGNVVSPDVVQGQYAAAMYGSSGRVSQSLMMSEPGSIAS
jgi:hypothetical protein